MNCPKYMRQKKDEGDNNGSDEENEDSHLLQDVSLDNHNLEHALNNVNTIDRVTKDTVSNKKVVKNIQNFFTLKFKDDPQA